MRHFWTRAVAWVLLGWTISYPLAISSVYATPVSITPTKSQGAVGFCTSYAAVAWIESEALNLGRSVDLSEEYLGLYRAFEALVYQLPALEFLAPNESRLAWKDQLLRNRIIRKIIASLATPPDGSNVIQILELAKRRGVIPERFFHIKYPLNLSPDLLPGKVIQRFILERLSTRQKISYFRTHPRAFERAYFDLFGQRLPTDSTLFVVDGKTYDPKTYLHDYLQVSIPNMGFVAFAPSNEDHIRYLVNSRLLRGHSVLMHFGTFADSSIVTRKAGVFSRLICPKLDCANPPFSHAVLITDIEFQGSRWDFLVKNSWFNDTGFDQNGAPVMDQTSGGFYKIQSDYLSMQTHQKWGIYVPVDEAGLILE